MQAIDFSGISALIGIYAQSYIHRHIKRKRNITSRMVEEEYKTFLI